MKQRKLRGHLGVSSMYLSVSLVGWGRPLYLKAARVCA